MRGPKAAQLGGVDQQRDDPGIGAGGRGGDSDRCGADQRERAGGQIECDTADDPDLHLVVDGERLDPVSREDCVYTFALARPPAGTLLVRSRGAVPSLIGLNHHEHRRLGVAVRQIIVHRPGVMTSFDPDGPVFTEGGCHPAESGYSWTDGELHLPAPLFAHLKGALTLIIHTQQHGMRYPIAAALAKAARRPVGSGPCRLGGGRMTVRG